MQAAEAYPTAAEEVAPLAEAVAEHPAAEAGAVVAAEHPAAEAPTDNPTDPA